MAVDRFLATALICLCFACGMPSSFNRPEVHGHRGCRGLMPENTLPAFLEATRLGCDWLEMDVVINAEGEVVVSHEPWMDHRNCLDRNGQPIEPQNERLLNIYKMTTADLQRFDCGSMIDPDFPDREPMAFVSKPLLKDLVPAVEEYAMEEGHIVPGFNIEIKSDPALYDEFQPAPAEFARLVMATIDDLKLGDHCMIQSFDPVVLEHVHRIDPTIPIALLVDNANGIDMNLRRLSFQPTVYSPAMELVNKPMVEALRERDIALAVWTVDDEADMKRMIALEVDAIITDYPDRLIKLLDQD
jgi:glycerophosphoryl diester phosphodiesterase